MRARVRARTLAHAQWLTRRVAVLRAEEPLDPRGMDHARERVIQVVGDHPAALPTIGVHRSEDSANSSRVLFACVVDTAVAEDAAAREALLRSRIEWFNAVLPVAARDAVMTMELERVIERPNYAVAELVSGFSQCPV